MVDVWSLTGRERAARSPFMNPRILRIALLIALACPAALVPAGVAGAATYTWVGTAGSPAWFSYYPNGLSGNWSPSGATLQPSDSLVFGVPGAGGSLTPEQNDYSPTITNLTFTPAAPGYTIFTDPLVPIDLYVLTMSGSLTNQSAFLQRFDNYVNFANAGTAVVDTGTAGIYLANLDQEGTGNFRKIGSGTLTMEYATAYRGTLTLEAGAMRIGNSGYYWGNIVQTAGTLAGTGSDAVDLYPYGNPDQLGNYTISGGSGLLAGARTVTQTGGTLVFAAPANGFDPPTVAENSTLNGTNSITGTVGTTVTFEAALALGGSNSTTLDVAGPGVADKYVVNGLLTYGGTLNINFTTSGSQANGTTWSLFDPLGGVSGSFATLNGTGQAPYAGLAWGLATSSTNTFDQRYGPGVWLSTWTGGQRLIFKQATGDITVVPEPSTFVMAGAGIAGCALLRWRRGRR